MLNKHQIFGQIGEAVATNYLKKNKYKILATNYITPLGEIDIIAKYKSIFIFVEVKTRATKSFGLPQDAVNKRKQQHIENSAEIFMKQHKLNDVDYRFDIIEIVGVPPDSLEINHIENAFV